MVRFRGREPQGAGDAGEDLAGRPRSTALLKPGVVLDGDVRENCNFFPPEPRGAPPRSRWKSNVFGAKPATPISQERREFRFIHDASVR